MENPSQRRKFANSPAAGVFKSPFSKSLGGKTEAENESKSRRRLREAARRQQQGSDPHRQGQQPASHTGHAFCVEKRSCEPFLFVVLKLPAPYPHPGAGGEQPLVN